ncbi:MAG: Nif3-like dinuclear metal center hexameric protein [Proteobacteria bacterium]|nr:Nif3-like dinuclear metal center hexameric protein [Pseudomonadota bacterium]
MDTLLRIGDVPDYPPALNGLQVDHRGPVTRIAAAVDGSARTIAAAAAAGANLLVVHHGLFWSGVQPVTGPMYARLRMLFDHDIAVYSAHLPLDAHETFGNSRLLALELGLEPVAGFGRYQTIYCGVRGESDVDTASLTEKLRAFARSHGGDVVASRHDAGRRTRRWAICSGAGASADTLREAETLGVDTLITGEGPHWSAVEAEERGRVILYAGHYATETLGVRALVKHLAATHALPWTFLPAPTGL